MPIELRASYRVQLHRDFTLDDAAALVDYLADLGISHLYCSPYLQSRQGSTHGYDVVDHAKINTELGGSEALDRLIEALDRRGMGHILDVVPNHMTITERANQWWWDVLKHGPYSDYAMFFDIDWDPAEERLKRNILIPILGDHYGRVLEKSEIKLEEDSGELIVRYNDHIFPIGSSSIDYAFGPETPVQEVIEKANENVEVMHALLELQYYRLAYWKTAGKELNYRRFFAINDLAALRMETPQVFEKVHELILTMVKSGRLDGLRIDHIDGLRYPTRYLKKLRANAPDAYIVVEKILEPTEDLPDVWPIEGTTGYDFLNRVGRLFVDPDGVTPMTELYEGFTGETVDIEAARRIKKMHMLDTEFGGEIERLTDLFVSVCENNHHYRDYTRAELREALRETAASISVYRTYVDPEEGVGSDDERYVHEAIASARAERPDLDGDLFDFLSRILLLQVEGPEAEALAVRFQQTTGPCVAKGVEDTFFYTFNRLLSLNEVGGDPAKFGCTLEEFHEENVKAQQKWPLAMLASSTHDTKRSEDVRARISLLSEIPDEWAEVVRRWSSMNAKHKRNDLPGCDIEYVLYQTLAGAYPLGVRRAEVFMQKAVREAKVHSSWIDPSPNYEAAVRGFLERVIGDREFEADLDGFMKRLIEPAWVSSLAQTLIKLTSPGVPDIYQGCEIWNYSLVDPDNRRQVDYKHRRQMLEQVRCGDAASAWAAKDEGAAKLYLTHKALSVRAEFPQAFGTTGSYEPIFAEGSHSHRVVAYSRGGNVLAVVPRLVMGLADGWAETRLPLPSGTWRDALSGTKRTGTVDMSDLLSGFPVALLVKS